MGGVLRLARLSAAFLGLSLGMLGPVSSSEPVLDLAANPPRVIPARVLADLDLNQPMSAQTAAAALEQVRELRDTLGDALIRERIGCYRRFFTSQCLNEVGARDRAVTERLDAVEVHVNQRLRDEEALEKNRRVAAEIAERQSAQAVEAERADLNRREHEARVAAAQESQQRREAQAPDVARRAESLRLEAERKQRVVAERREAAERRAQQAPAQREARNQALEAHRREQAERAQRDAERAARARPVEPSRAP